MGTFTEERILLMSASLDNAITCCNRSWSGECQICEQRAYDDYIREMHDDWESRHVDDGDMEDYEDDDE
jgi:hypothetical protein